MWRRSFLVLAILLAACGGQLSTGGGVSGTWTGTFTSTSAPFALELSQTGASLSGTLTVGENAVAMTGTTAQGPTDTLVSLSSQGPNPVRLEASVSGDSMRGTLAVKEAGDITSGAFTATR